MDPAEPSETTDDGPDLGSLLYGFARGSGILFVALAVELMFRFLGKVLIARVLGQVAFGVVVIGITTVTVVSMIATVGLNKGVGRFYPRSDDEAYRRGVVISALQIAVPVSILAGGLVFLLAGPMATLVFDDPALTPVFRITALAIPFAVVVKMAVGAVQGRELTRPKILVQNVAMPFFRLAFFAGALLLGARAVGVAWAYTLAVVLPACLGVYYIHRYTDAFSPGEWRPMHREMLSYSSPMMLRNTMTMILVQADTFLLGALATVAATGVYNTVYPLAMLITIGHKATDFLYLPLVSGLHADDARQEIGTIYRLVSKWLFIVSVPLLVVFGVFPELAIRWTYGPEYVSGALALTILVAGFFVDTVAGVNGRTLEAIGSTRVVMYATTIAATVNLALNWLLIPRYTVVGAAIATTVAYLLLNGIYTARLYQETGIVPVDRTIARFGVASLSLVALFAAVKFALLDPGLSGSLVLLAGFGLCYLVVVVVLGLDRPDVELLMRAERELGVDLAPVKRVVAPFLDW